MAWIKVIDEPDATGELKAAYDGVAGARGHVANIWKIHSTSPPAMRSHLALYRDLAFGPSDLSRRDREAIAVAVSTANGCHY